jgi:hypothetical protein
MYDTQRFAIVVTRTGGRDRLLDMPWLETDYQIDESDWVVLSDEGWRAVAEGDVTIWDALERKLFVGFYVSRPQLIAVIGHPAGREGSDASDGGGGEEVRRIVRRIRSLLLPAAVLGFWADESGALLEIVEPAECAERERALTEESSATTG